MLICWTHYQLVIYLVQLSTSGNYSARVKKSLWLNANSPWPSCLWRDLRARWVWPELWTWTPSSPADICHHSEDPVLCRTQPRVHTPSYQFSSVTCPSPALSYCHEKNILEFKPYKTISLTWLWLPLWCEEDLPPGTSILWTEKKTTFYFFWGFTPRIIYIGW